MVKFRTTSDISKHLGVELLQFFKIEPCCREYEYQGLICYFDKDCLHVLPIVGRKTEKIEPSLVENGLLNGSYRIVEVTEWKKRRIV